MNQGETVFELNWLSVELVTNSAKHREDPHIRQPPSAHCHLRSHLALAPPRHIRREKARGEAEGNLTEVNPNGR